MWFDSWHDILRVVLVGTAAYVTLVAVLRFSGKRTLAKLNAFDFVVTVAFGSTLASVVTSKDVALAEGAAALALLAAAQFVVASVTARISRLRDVVTARPTRVVADGHIIPEALRQHRLSEAEVRQVVRGAGYGDLSGVGAVVLETDGTLSVIGSGHLGPEWSLTDVV